MKKFSVSIFANKVVFFLCNVFPKIECLVKPEVKLFEKLKLSVFVSKQIFNLHLIFIRVINKIKSSSNYKNMQEKCAQVKPL